MDGEEHEHRNPDAWERVCLAQALLAFFSGCYELATSEARLALTTPDQRSPTTNLPNDPIFSRCDLPLLMQELRKAKTEPVKQFPHFAAILNGPGLSSALAIRRHCRARM